MALTCDITVRHPQKGEVAAAIAVADAAFALIRHVYRPRGDAIAHEAARAKLGTRLVAIHTGKLVGTVQYELHTSHVHLIGLAVHPEWQSRGVARALVTEVLSLAPRLGHRTVALDTIRETGNVRKFSALGFHVVAESVTTLFESDSFSVLHEVKMDRSLESAAA